RGPQTSGEIKGRTERLCHFAGTAEAEGLMQELASRPEPMLARMPRQPGQKEARFRHLFSAAAAGAAPPVEPAAAGTPPPAEGTDRLAALEARVAELEKVLGEMKGGSSGPPVGP
ncbi:MAG: DUF480 domain-containing protein, partial [Elusimicrobiales bacterium]|nr:DUF480 domain-containing protein [Elusimicrobiales bacterium]